MAHLSPGHCFREKYRCEGVFPDGSVVKNLPAIQETLGSIPGSGRSPGGGGGGNDNALQYSCLENPMGLEA